MPLTSGTRLGPYDISAQIGVGGMGEVYRATDTNLGRQVAIKVLPESVAADAERLLRFDREAKTLAALNHPNIAAIYGVERSGSRTALVMELVEGRTLAERIAEGPLPLDEALAVAKPIADALEAAHEKGIIHRDLKPANIKLRADGAVKVLDFGLAKAMESQGGASSVSMSPTITSPAMTELGVILGTAAYMSPEQAKGRPADKRSDIWAFGCVLYEMLTGTRAFDGEDVTETLASVVKDRVDVSRVPQQVRRLIAKCLERDPKSRLRDIGDAWALLEPDHSAVPQQVARTRGSSVAWLSAAAATAIAVTLAVIHFREIPIEAPLLNATLLPPEGTTFDFNTSYAVPSLSPDGSRIVFGARNAAGVVQLWMRRLDSATAQPLPGTERAVSPFWSPDSRFVAFEQNQELKKIDIQGGPPITVTKVRNLRGGTWNRDGVILFATNGVDPIQRVPAAGGTATPATTLQKGDTSGNRYPYFLPDQKHFFYTAPTGQLPFPVRVGTLDEPGGTGKVVADVGSNVVYSTGHIFFLRENTLMAQPFDAERLETTRDAVPVAERVPTFASPSRMAGFDVSAAGWLIYQAGGGETQTRLVWMDRTGKALTPIAEGDQFGFMQVSPDGNSLAISSPDASGRPDVWIFDLTRTGVRRRFTFDAASDGSAIWTPDGATIVWRSNRKNPGDLFLKPSNGTGVDELLFEDTQPKTPLSISPDGKVLLFTSPNTSPDIWALPLDSAQPRKPRPVVDSPFADTDPQFHPTGNWIAYSSSESGPSEVYVAPYPGPGGKLQVSTATGMFPHWRRDGKELFYVTENGELMAAQILMKDGALRVGSAERLFGGILVDRGYLYAPAADGQRFIVAQDTSPAGSPPLTLIQNWQALLKR